MCKAHGGSENEFEIERDQGVRKGRTGGEYSREAWE